MKERKKERERERMKETLLICFACLRNKFNESKHFKLRFVYNAKRKLG
jgi:hypothetical protein